MGYKRRGDRKKFCSNVQGTGDRNRPPWPDTMVSTYISYLITGGPGKKCRTNKLPPIRRIWERSKERGNSSPLSNLPESASLESVSAE